MKENLTNRQIALVLFGIIVEYGIHTLPKNVALATGTGGWTTLAFNTIFFMFMAYIVTYIQYSNENKTLYGYSREFFGKYVAAILAILYIVYFMMIVTMDLRIYAEILRLILLNKTPVWATLFVFYSIVFFATSKKLQAIGRLAEFYSLLVIIGYLFLIFIVFTKAKLINMQPFFEGSQVPKYIKAIYRLMLPFLGVEILLLIPMDKAKNKNIFRYTILTMLGVGVLYILNFESSISVGGIESVINQKAPLFQTLRGLDVYRLEILRRLDGLYFIFWTMNMFTSGCIWSYGTTTLINDLIPKLKVNYILIVVVISEYIISLLPRTMMEIDQVMKIFSGISMATSIAIPIIIFIITKVKKYEKKI